MGEIKSDTNDLSDAASQPSAASHGFNWFGDDMLKNKPTIICVKIIQWLVKISVGNNIGEISYSTMNMSSLEYFPLIFPPKQIKLICNFSNNEQ